MTDIVTRLRNWRTVHLARLHLLMDEAADEMERLRADWPEQLAAARSEVERLRGYRDAAESDRTVALLAAERMRQVLSQKNHCPDADNAAAQDILTDEEREAVETALGEVDGLYPETAATLRGLLERLK